MPDTVKLQDQPHRDAILLDLETSILVEAGAGTGKTTSMVGRILALLRSGYCGIDQFACMTFTTRAAGELRERFADALAEQIAQPLPDDERVRLQHARDNLERASIGTIHSFCSRLLRERPVEAGIDPGFSVLDDIGDSNLRREAWRQFVAGMPPESSRSVLQLGVDVEEVFRAFDHRCDYPEAEFPLGIEEPPDEVGTLQHIRQWCAAREYDIREGKRNEFIDALRQCVRLIDIAPPDLRTVSAVLSLIDRKHAVQVRVWQDKDTADEIAAAFEQLRQDVLAPLRQRLYAHRYPWLLALIAGAMRRYDALRAEAGALNHNDLLLRTRDMLRDNPTVRLALQKQFTHLLVDEFQDTDPLQAEILMYLVSEEAVSADWSAMRIKPGALFVVGDPRQSIYRFRRADITIYNRMRRAIEHSGGVVRTLSTSFRSVSSICTWVNGAFNGPVFGRESTDAQPAAAALHAVHSDAGALCGVYEIPVPLHGPKHDAENLRINEADIIADWIAMACSAPMKISGHDHEQETRALLHEDILVLVREHADILPLAIALEKRQVPVLASGGHALAAHPEVRHLLNALRILLDPENPVPVIAFLRGPFCGADDRALLSYKRAGGLFAFNARALPGVDPRINEGMQFIKDTVRLVRSNPPGTVVASMIERLALHAAASTGMAGWLQAASVQTLVEQVQQYSTQGASIPDIIQHLEQLFAGSRGPGVPADTSMYGVRIMTLHSAKGLEAPVVILASGRGVKAPGTDMVIDRNAATPRGMLRLRKTGPFRSDVIAQPLDWPEHAALELEFLRAEQLRLAYVASTRARSALILTLPEVVGRGRSSPWSMFDEAMLQALPDPVSSKPPGAQSTAPGDPAAEDAAPSDPAAVERAIADRHAALRAETYLRQRPSALKSDVPASAPGGDGGDGRAFGSAMHRLLEEAALGEIEDAHSLASSLAKREGLPSDAADDLLSLLQQVRGHELWKRMRSAERLFVELPFAHPITENGISGVMHGVMDVVFHDGEGWIICDYKTDAEGTEEERALLYRPQITAYCEAWQMMTGEPARGLLWFLRSGIVME